MTLVAAAVVAVTCCVSGVALAAGPGDAAGQGFTTGAVASNGANNNAHFDGRGKDAPLINPAEGNPPGGGLPGFGRSTAGK